MGSLIEASIERGHVVYLLYSDEELGSKAYQRVTPEKLFLFDKVGVKIAKIDLNELADLRKSYKIDILVTHEGFHFLKNHLFDLNRLRNSGTKVVSLSHFFETANNPLEALDHFDKTYYLSDFALELHFCLNLPLKEKRDAKYLYKEHYQIAGSPMFDQLNGLSYNEIKRELNIPAKKRTVLLVAPVISPSTLWRFYVWKENKRLDRIVKVFKDRQWTYLWDAFFEHSFSEIVSAIRRVCDKNDAFLIIKTRQKQVSPPYLIESADMFFDGRNDVYYPTFTTYRLIAASDFVITSMSMAVAEAVAIGKSVLNIFIPPSNDFPDLWNSPLKGYSNYLEAVMGLKKRGPFNQSDCIYNISPSRVIDWLDHNNIFDINPNNRAIAKYKKRYLGISEIPSYSRILQSLESL